MARIILGIVKFDRETLILEGFADTSEVLHRELMLYQLHFTAAGKDKRLTEDEIQKAVERGRMEGSETINEVSRATHRTAVRQTRTRMSCYTHYTPAPCQRIP